MIEDRFASIAYWNRRADEEEAKGNAAVATTFRNVAWLLEHPEGWIAFIKRERIEANLPN